MKVPQKYRNTLFQWRVSAPYDGCLWTLSHGVVDGYGDYHPINVGYDLNDDAWYKARMERIRAEEDNPDCPRSKKIADCREEHQNRLNRMFTNMLHSAKDHLDSGSIPNQFGATIEDLRLYRIDDDDDVDLRLFCRRLDGDAGMMCGVLDKVAELEDENGYRYNPLCVCSECGKEFHHRDIDYENFSDLIDTNAYHGNGGVGVVYTTVFCPKCHEAATCPECNETNIRLDGGKPDISGLDSNGKFMYQWLGVCEFCASGFFRERPRFEAAMGEFEEWLFEGGDKPENRKELIRRVNALRDRFAEEAREHFTQGWGFDERVNEDDADYQA